MLRVSGSTSQNIKLAPREEKTLEVDIQEFGVVITSSPGFMPNTIPAKNSPAVAEMTVKAFVVPQNSANASSNSFTFLLQEGAPFFRTFINAFLLSGHRTAVCYFQIVLNFWFFHFKFNIYLFLKKAAIFFRILTFWKVSTKSVTYNGINAFSIVFSVPAFEF